MRGSLQCAAHGETVSSFGRDDDFLVWVRENRQRQRSKVKGRSLRDDNKKSNSNDNGNSNNNGNGNNKRKCNGKCRGS